MMAIPPWAVDVLRRGVGGVMEKMPPDAIDQLKKRATDLFNELPQTAAKSVDSVLRNAKAGKESLHRWSRRHIALVTPVVNASGCLTNPKIAGVPIGNDAIEVAVEAFQSGALTSDVARDRLQKRLTKTIASSDVGVLVTSTIDGACLGIASANRGVPIYCHRSQSQRLASGSPIPDAFGAGHEVGSIDRIDANDTRSIPDSAVVVGVDNGTDGAWFKSMASSATRVRVMLLPIATLNGSDVAITPKPASILATLSNAADLVVTPGDATMGGPRCGLIIGKRALLDKIVASAVWPAVVADISVQAAMTMTMESLAAGDVESVPVLAMMATSEENLRSRAERLVTRIAAESIVRSCEVTDKPATLSPSGPWSLPSRQLKMSHRDLSAIDWAAKLAADVPAVIVAVDGEYVVVDLRWIQPVDDVALVATLVGGVAESVA